ncbi:copper homeostasis protein CutC [Cellulomonas hominis]|uniref:PF03932 family protein CutC n=1 Tax=Cellulomonas hominis TaxID=156981 RepID=A0A7Z8K3S4_9CELL|nr:copper homeostasis protein CutC [Cellulomonas hominis]TKR27026.1 copper homeostasis protein CutC [Cellulomonas hominis]
MPASRPVLEIAVQDLAGYRVAADGGAARTEVCAALAATGGLTPGAGLLAALVAERDARAARGDAAPGVHVLVRPRPGPFVYDADELDVQVREVRAAVGLGVDGVVVGPLTADGRVDERALAALLRAADGREVTFHRAVDSVADPLAVLDALAGAGVTRVLSSGGEARSIDGVRRLAAMVEHTAGAVQVMAGGGVRPVDIGALIAAGVDAVHLSASRTVAGDGGPGGGGSAGGWTVTDPEVVAQAAAALARA